MHILVMTRIITRHSHGGMQKQTMDLCYGFVKAGHDVTILTTGRVDGVEYENDQGCEIHYLSGSKPGRYSLNWNKLSKLAIAKLHIEKPIDVIHSQSMGSRPVLRWAKKNKVPVVSTWHGTCFTEMSSFFSSASYHPRYWHWLLIMPSRFLRQYFTMELPVRKGSRAITLVSPTLEPKMKIFAKNKVTTISNGIETIDLLPKPQNPPVEIIAIGRMERQKGIHHAINAIAKLTPEKRQMVHLNVVGEGPYLHDLKSLIEKHDLHKSATCFGRLPDKELFDIYQKCVIHLMPTTRQEGLPLTVLEGMSFGLATIASDIGGIPSVISDGIDGLLIEPGNEQQLTSLLSSLLDNPTKIITIGTQARKTIEDKYSRERMVAETLQILVDSTE